jgi:hypothetical protein
MPFGLTNAPASFQQFINDTLRESLDDFVNAYLDDILIYSETYEENVCHTRKVLQLLSNAGLHLKPEKCEFHVQTVKYLGVILTPNGIQMDPAKVVAVQEWPTPKILRTTLPRIRQLLPAIYIGIFQEGNPAYHPNPQGHAIHMERGLPKSL